MSRLWILVASLTMLPRSGLAQTLDQLISPGELSTAHAKYSGVNNCNACHGSDKNVLESKCLDCHKELAARIAAREGFHAGKSTGCVSCHSEHLGKEFDIRPLDRATFNHDETGYKLAGKHALVKDCARCHKARTFLGSGTMCQSCHSDKHQGRLPSCEACHSVDRPFKQVSFDHGTSRYPLAGAHTRVACVACHKNGVVRGLAFEQCGACHTDPHHSALGPDCSRCHRLEQWKAVDQSENVTLGARPDAGPATDAPQGVEARVHRGGNIQIGAGCLPELVPCAVLGRAVADRVRKDRCTAEKEPDPRRQHAACPEHTPYILRHDDCSASGM